MPFQSNLCPRRPEVCQPAPVPHWIEIRGDGPKAIRVRRAWRCHCRINTSCRVDNRHSLVMKTGNYFATAGKLETVNREPVSALPPDADMCSAAAQFGPEADSAARTSVARGVLIGPVIVPLNSTFDRTQLKVAFSYREMEARGPPWVMLIKSRASILNIFAKCWPRKQTRRNGKSYVSAWLKRRQNWLRQRTARQKRKNNLMNLAPTPANGWATRRSFCWFAL